MAPRPKERRGEEKEIQSDGEKPDRMKKIKKSQKSIAARFVSCVHDRRKFLLQPPTHKQDS
jgi:hypothetical protein